MKVSADVRESAYVRKLRRGDVISEPEGFFEVTRAPEVVDGERVRVYLLPVDGGRVRSTAFDYDIDTRVRVVPKHP